MTNYKSNRTTVSIDSFLSFFLSPINYSSVHIKTNPFLVGGVQKFLNRDMKWKSTFFFFHFRLISHLILPISNPRGNFEMGICWGTPHYPTPSFSGYLRPGQPQLTFSSSSDDEDSFGGRFNCTNGTIPPTPNLRIFSFDELKAATSNFRNDTLVGEGGFGRVFKGHLEDTPSSNAKGRVEIAIKKLNPESVQGFKEWKSEVTFLGSLYHPNIVQLLGYCREDTKLLLVYEYIPRGSLKKHLYGRDSSVQLLPWEMRLKIALGSAKGLAYLHQLEIPIICRDFKSSNILLDKTYNAKISDFGLAKKGPTGDQSYVTTQVMGTYGYAAPEYVATGHLYLKSDVYSFGVVLLEILAGRRAFDKNRPRAQMSLVDWLKPNLSRRKLVRVMDPRLEGKYPLKDALQVAELAVQCVRSEPKQRPSMAEVVKSLEKIAAL